MNSGPEPQWMSLRESLESTLPEVARVVHIFNQTAEAIPTSVAPPRSWRRAGVTACKAEMGKVRRGCGCGSAAVCLEGARVRDWGGRGRAEEEERDRGTMKPAVVLPLLNALALVLAATTARRRRSREARARFIVVVVMVLHTQRGACVLLASRGGGRCCC